MLIPDHGLSLTAARTACMSYGRVFAMNPGKSPIALSLSSAM
jgi:hypothetical protein